MSAPVSVTGGADGIEANIEDLCRLGALFHAAACDVGGVRFVLHGYLADLEGGVFSPHDPSGWYEAMRALECAVNGPDGLLPLAARCAALEHDLRTAATRYLEADVLGGDRSLPAVDLLVGNVRAVGSGLGTLCRTGNPVAAFSAAIASEPVLTNDVMALLNTVVDHSPIPLRQEWNALLLDGHAVVRTKGADVAADARGAPRTFADVVAGLARRDNGEPGEIDIRRITAADGSTSYIVDIPGTNTFAPWPTSDVTSLPTNVRAVEGRSTSYERGVLKAMARAGITSTDRVMLVGHSEGGMVAINAAARCARSGSFNVTNVITAGAPIGRSVSRLPSSVQVLAIENRHDVVPELDGTKNEPRPNVTTVVVNHDHHAVFANHKSANYVRGAADIDRSNNPSIQAFRASATPFLSGTGVTTTSFVIRRGY